MAEESGDGKTSDWVTRERIWNRFWKMKVPDDMKILTWRLFYNAPPVFHNLLRRGVGDRRKCALCGFEEKNTRHLFMECWWLKSVWNSMCIKGEMLENAANPGDWL